MLIYNYKKEFIGIDEGDLKVLGLSNLSELKSEADDFAELFVKNTGLIHNFAHIHWIDYVVCGDSNIDYKVLIRLKNREFNASLEIKTIYLNDNPLQKAYMVMLTNLRQNLTGNTTIDDSIQKSSFVAQNSDIKIDLPPIKQAPEIQIKPKVEEKISLDLDFGEPKTTPKVEVVKKVEDDYIFNPRITSEELGLPLDLVEEFVCDFVAQANSFKNNMYSHLKDSDLKNLRILAHQLKGVASNLRIQDALDTLIILNTSSDFNELKYALNRFFQIVGKLADDSSITDETVCHQEYKNPDLSLAQDDIPDDIRIVQLNENIDKPIKNSITPKVNIKTQQIKPIYDKEKVAQEIGLDGAIFNDIFSQYTKEAYSIIKEIKELLSSGDTKRISSLAIELRSMSENMRVTLFNSELENIINRNSSNIKDDIEFIISILNQIS